MKRELMRIIAMGIIIPLFLSGCILTRGVDRKFLGAGVSRAEHPNRKVLGITILPIAFALDVATFPLQAILLMIFGDSFPYDDLDGASLAALSSDPRFQRIPADARTRALAELPLLLRSGRVSGDTALVLREDGNWEIVYLSARDRERLYARASGEPLLMTAQTAAR